MRRTNLRVLAWRNLWRNRRRTLITLSSIAIGVFLAVLFTAGQDRNWADLIDLAARMGGGHVTIQHPEFLDTPTNNRTVVRTQALMDLARQQPGVTRVVPRIVGQVMLATARESYGAGFMAFDPALEDRTTMTLDEALASGTWLRSSEEGGIILGDGLASNLGLSLGKKVVYTMTDKNGEIVSGLARVTGLLHTGSPGVDMGLCLLPLTTVSRILGYEADEVQQIAVFIDDQRRCDRVADDLNQAAGPQVRAWPWHVVQPELAGFIAMKVGGARFMEILIAVLVAAGIFNTMFVSVLERLREFGIMLAIGFRPGDLFKLVMLESLWLGLVGLVLSVLLTIGPYWYLSSTGIDLSSMLQGEGSEVAGVAISPVLKIGIFPSNAVIIAVAALLATLLAGLYPAWRAGRVTPVESIRLV
jgi:ABC-type lipoprotein release transport system permease subunit